MVILQHLCKRIGTDIIGSNVTAATVPHAVAYIFIRYDTRVIEIGSEAVPCPSG